VEAGYRATLDMLDKVGRPVPQLRRRLSLAEQRADGGSMTPFMATVHAAAE
jgi:hypothetical protein